MPTKLNNNFSAGKLNKAWSIVRTKAQHQWSQIGIFGPLDR
jgi:hypothetical protein